MCATEIIKLFKLDSITCIWNCSNLCQLYDLNVVYQVRFTWVRCLMHTFFTHSGAPEGFSKLKKIKIKKKFLCKCNVATEASVSLGQKLFWGTFNYMSDKCRSSKQKKSIRTNPGSPSIGNWKWTTYSPPEYNLASSPGLDMNLFTRFTRFPRNTTLSLKQRKKTWNWPHRPCHYSRPSLVTYLHEEKICMAMTC